MKKIIPYFKTSKNTPMKGDIIMAIDSTSIIKKGTIEIAVNNPDSSFWKSQELYLLSDTDEITKDEPHFGYNEKGDLLMITDSSNGIKKRLKIIGSTVDVGRKIKRNKFNLLTPFFENKEVSISEEELENILN